MKTKATAERNDAKRNLETTIKRAFQHILFLAQPDDETTRGIDEVSFDDKTETALHGTLVWKALVEKGKAFDQGTFSTKALLHNLRENDYGRPLDELRDSFWNTPRLPLLHGGQSDLRQALFDAVRSDLLRIVDSEGEEVAVTGVSEINLSSQRLRLGKPIAPATDEQPQPGLGDNNLEAEPVPGAEQPGRQEGPRKPENDPAAPPEQQITFSVTQSMLNSTGDSEGLSQLFRQLYDIVDRGDVSFLQASFQMVLNAQSAEDLAGRIKDLNFPINIRDM